MWGRKRADELETVNLLEVKPVRLAWWEEKGDRVVVSRPLSARTGLAGMVDRLLFLLSARRIRLDSVGSFAWQQFDGEFSVGQVAELLRAEFGDKVEPTEERLGHLVRVFRREGLVGFPGWDDGLLSRKGASGR